MIKILYIDSDESYGKSFLDFLIEKNYEVKYSKSIKEAYSQYSFYQPDIIITEQNIKDGTGTYFIKKIKENLKDTKTILLTSMASQEIFLEALELKIDKVLFKDNSFKDINGQIRSLNISNKSLIKLNNTTLFDLGEEFFYDQSSFRIIHQSDFIQLTTQESLLIQKLLEQKGEYVSFNILQNYIGKNEPTSIETLRTVVKKIRKKTYNTIIENKSGVGYKIYFNKEISLKGKFAINNNINLNCKVLILKGNKKQNELLGYSLTKFGLSCESVYTIKDAKILLEVQKYDYIIIDLNLPDGDSIDFIRDIEDTRTTKLIILSDSIDIHYKEYLYFKGIIDYIIDSDDINYLGYNIYKTILKVETNTKYNNILVVEKSKKICEQLKDILLPRNYNITVLNKLDNAMEIVKKGNFSLIIVDLDFEECYNFLTDVKTTVDKYIPFIVLSDTHRNYEVVRDSYKYGAAECLRKPIYAEEFILKTDQLTENSKLIGELDEQKEFMQAYQDIVDKTTIVSKTNKKGIITYVNEMFCNISGYSSDELVGKSHNIVRDPSVPQELFENLWKTIKDDKKIWEGIITNKAKDGSIYKVQSSIMPILDDDGEAIEFIALRKELKE